jgi:hypothetical protein
MLEAKAHVGICSKMKHQFGTSYGLGQLRLIQHISLHQPEMLVCLGLVDEPSCAGREIVITNDNIAAREKAIDQIAPNEAGGAGDEDLHD